jgi:hypothetical protein
MGPVAIYLRALRLFDRIFNSQFVQSELAADDLEFTAVRFAQMEPDDASMSLAQVL